MSVAEVYFVKKMGLGVGGTGAAGIVASLITVSSFFATKAGASF